MAGLKSLAKETAIYGVSSIVGRFLNYLLVPVYTIALPASSGGYGVVTNIYAWVALMLVLLTLAPLLTSKPFAAVEPEELTIVSAAVPLTVIELVPFNVVPTAEAPAAMVILEESLATVLLMEPPF